MELMSWLLLCAVVAFSPQAFGKPNMQYTDYDNLKQHTKNSTIDYRQTPTQNNVLLYLNKPPSNNTRMYFESIFMDVSCKNCVDCMEHAIQANKKRARIDYFNEDMSRYNMVVDRKKRQTDLTDTNIPEDTGVKVKKSKSKKNKINKSVTVTKYTVEGEVTALKVKETNTQIGEQSDDVRTSATCQVYSVKEHHPCDSPESDLILAAAKRKANKKSKKEKDKNRVNPSTQTPKLISAAFRKREVDNSQLPENVMSSVEELY